MAENNYIYEIFSNKLEQEIEHDFETDYPYVKATFVLNNPLFTQIVMRLFDRKQQYITTFVGTDFDCYNANEEKLDNNKSQTRLDNKEVKRWYLRWMKNHFDTYKADYIANINKVANEDLGI